ncbi:acyl carrier protein [Labilibacter marinus]|uniref:acyl carrier protein n=1 Tax=Labilibacter marinus TaxID=1477105 RepID=UPI0009F8FE4A|nr:acyl carrier protein [Labilibacter marinus]
MKEQIKNFIAETTFIDASTINDDTLIFDEGIFDSMGLLSLISFIEEEYGVVAEDTELQEDNFGSVERIAAFVEKKKAA